MLLIILIKAQWLNTTEPSFVSLHACVYLLFKGLSCSRENRSAVCSSGLSFVCDLTAVEVCDISLLLRVFSSSANRCGFSASTQLLY